MEKSIIAFDKRTNDAFKIMFDNEGKTTFKFDINEENDISIEPIIENKKLNESVHIMNSKEINDEKNNINKDNDKLITQSVNIFNNNLNINNDEIKLKDKNEKGRLPEINNNEENINPNDINSSNADKNKDNNGLKKLEIKFEQEAKERDSGKLLYKFKKSPRLYISGNSNHEEENNNDNENKDKENVKNENYINNIQERNDNINININEEKKKKENIIEDNNKINNKKVKNIEKGQNKYNNAQIQNNIKVISMDKDNNSIQEEKEFLKNENIYKTPINPKLFQSQDLYKTNNLSNSKRSISNNNSSRNFDKSAYLYNDSHIKNNEYNNYLFHEMPPHFKNKKNRVNSLSNLEIKIKNPFSKSKIIKKKEINGLNYSLICEKIIDKNNLPLYENLNLNENYSLENEYGNHKLYISHYTNADGEDFSNIFEKFEQERRTQQPRAYNTLNFEKSQTERNKYPNKITLF